MSRAKSLRVLVRCEKESRQRNRILTLIVGYALIVCTAAYVVTKGPTPEERFDRLLAEVKNNRVTAVTLVAAGDREKARRCIELGRRRLREAEELYPVLLERKPTDGVLDFFADLTCCEALRRPPREKPWRRSGNLSLQRNCLELAARACE